MVFFRFCCTAGLYLGHVSVLNAMVWQIFGKPVMWWIVLTAFQVSVPIFELSLVFLYLNISTIK